MPAPTNERQRLEQELAELPEQIAAYQRELDATPIENRGDEDSSPATAEGDAKWLGRSKPHTKRYETHRQDDPDTGSHSIT